MLGCYKFQTCIAYRRRLLKFTGLNLIFDILFLSIIIFTKCNVGKLSSYLNLNVFTYSRKQVSANEISEQKLYKAIYLVSEAYRRNEKFYCTGARS